MILAEPLAYLMGANAGLTGLVGTKTYPGLIPQGTTYPAIAFRLAGEQSDTILESPGTNGQVAVRVRFFSTASTYKQAQQVDEALVTALVGQAGTFAGVRIQGIFHAPLAADDYDDTTKTYQFVRDFTVHAVR